MMVRDVIVLSSVLVRGRWWWVWAEDEDERRDGADECGDETTVDLGKAARSMGARQHEEVW
jgi:hypothetical protein